MEEEKEAGSRRVRSTSGRSSSAKGWPGGETRRSRKKSPSLFVLSIISLAVIALVAFVVVLRC